MSFQMHTKSRAPVLGAAILLLGVQTQADGFTKPATASPAAHSDEPAAQVERPTFSNPTEITNIWAPFKVGGVKVFRGRADGHRFIVVHDYLDATRTFEWAGTTVEARIIHETEFARGKLIEDAYEYFAQADDGTLYYFGEVTSSLERGVVVSNDGSWLVGGPTLPTDPPDAAAVDEPTVYMPREPQVGDRWKKDDILPVADTTVTVLKVGLTSKVEAGKFKQVFKVRETSLEPGAEPERKWIAPGVGVIRTDGEGERIALIATNLKPKPRD